MDYNLPPSVAEVVENFFSAGLDPSFDGVLPLFTLEQICTASSVMMLSRHSNDQGVVLCIYDAEPYVPGDQILRITNGRLVEVDYFADNLIVTQLAGSRSDCPMQVGIGPEVFVENHVYRIE